MCWRDAEERPLGDAFQTLSAASSSPWQARSGWRRFRTEVASGPPMWLPLAGPRTAVASPAGRR